MKRFIAAAASVAFLAFPIGPASAFFFEGAHNPTWVDDPDIPNCTLVGPNSYENNPDCETYLRFPPAAGSAGEAYDCRDILTVLACLDVCCNVP